MDHRLPLMAHLPLLWCHMSLFADIKIYDQDGRRNEFELKYKPANLAIIEAIKYIRNKDSKSAWSKFVTEIERLDNGLIEAAEKIGERFGFD